MQYILSEVEYIDMIKSESKAKDLDKLITLLIDLSKHKKGEELLREFLKKIEKNNSKYIYSDMESIKTQM